MRPLKAQLLASRIVGSIAGGIRISIRSTVTRRPDAPRAFLRTFWTSLTDSECPSCYCMLQRQPSPPVAQPKRPIRQDPLYNAAYKVATPSAAHLTAGLPQRCRGYIRTQKLSSTAIRASSLTCRIRIRTHGSMGVSSPNPPVQTRVLAPISTVHTTYPRSPHLDLRLPAKHTAAVSKRGSPDLS